MHVKRPAGENVSEMNEFWQAHDLNIITREGKTYSDIILLFMRVSFSSQLLYMLKYPCLRHRVETLAHKKRKFLPAFVRYVYKVKLFGGLLVFITYNIT